MQFEGGGVASSFCECGGVNYHVINCWADDNFVVCCAMDGKLVSYEAVKLFILCRQEWVGWWFLYGEVVEL